jgi:tetratricopeptide (TPR) repeat protein
MMKIGSWMRNISVVGMLWIPSAVVGSESSADNVALPLDLGSEASQGAVEAIPESIPPDLSELDLAITAEIDAAVAEPVAAGAVEADAAVAEPVAAGAVEADAAVAESVAPGAVEADAAVADPDAAIASRDAVVAERDAAVAERDAARERIVALDAELVAMRTQRDAIRAAAGERDAEVTRLQNALASAQAANAQERFALAYNLGNIYKAARQYTRAETEFLKALKMNPDDAALHYNLGILYDDNLDNGQKARQHYERFLELAPNDPDAPNVVMWLKDLN